MVKIVFLLTVRRSWALLVDGTAQALGVVKVLYANEAEEEEHAEHWATAFFTAQVPHVE